MVACACIGLIIYNSITSGRSNNERMPLDWSLTSQSLTKPFPAPDAAKSLFLHTSTELTHERALFSAVAITLAGKKRKAK